MNKVNPENLRLGIKRLLDRHQEQGKPSFGDWDFHNSLYQELTTLHSRPLDPSAWSFLVKVLWDWRAIRGNNQNNTKNAIYRRGLAQLDSLDKYATQIRGKIDYSIEGLAKIEWNDVNVLFELAKSIKGVSSPTFASKLCHFLAPCAYFPTDSVLIKQNSKLYSEYWKHCRDEWLEQINKCQLVEILRNHFPLDCQISEQYPWSVKISEFCQFADAKLCRI